MKYGKDLMLTGAVLKRVCRWLKFNGVTIEEAIKSFTAKINAEL